MPNIALKDNFYGDNDGEKEKYTSLAMQESRLNKAKKECIDNHQCSEYQRLGGEAELKRLENLIHLAQQTNHNGKEIKMKAGAENQFIQKHEKDRDNANPTAVGGLPKMTKGSISDKIMTNKEVYNEELLKEISEMKYLITYMDNNKKQKI